MDANDLAIKVKPASKSLGLALKVASYTGTGMQEESTIPAVESEPQEAPPPPSAPTVSTTLAEAITAAAEAPVTVPEVAASPFRTRPHRL